MTHPWVANVRIAVEEDMGNLWKYAVLFQAVIVATAIQQGPISLGEYVYPESGNALYWLMTMFVLGWIPLVGLYMFCTRGGFQVGTLDGLISQTP